ncbi:MAG TPA: hypothetical protein VFO52_07830 [Longimicrobiales bacterium]|nr:hypothetical protein [Longimicrobiales bacterium]
MKHTWMLLLVVITTTAAAQDANEHAKHSHAVLGTVDFKNSGAAAAQPAFQRGVALLHSFEYQDAAEEFRAARRADPSLALTYWLEALTYNRVLWGLDDVARSRAVLAQLGNTPESRLAKANTERERAFGAVVEAFYIDQPLSARARAFADAALKHAAANPTDHEAAVFAALASMMAWQTSPPATPDRQKYNDAVKQHALRVFRENPQHPGAAHYLIHFVDMNPHLASEALEFARAYDKIAPDAEHALHMPSHVYLPLGMWPDVVAANERAWPASRRAVLANKESPANNSWHSLDWLQYAYLQLGRYEDARALVDTANALLRGVDLEPGQSDARNIVGLLAFRYGLETGKWDAYPAGIPAIDVVLGQPRPSARAWTMATNAAYQTAVASLRGQQDRAPMQTVIRVFRSQADSLPASDQRRNTLLRLATQMEAMLAHGDGDTQRALSLLEQIAPTEPSNASLPPTTIPSDELLGQYLLAANRPADAAAAFERVLRARANRSASVRGLEQARQAQR